MAQLDEGDIVKLRSGGPLMTVISADDENAYCVWFDVQSQAHTKTFRVATIIREETSQIRNGIPPRTTTPPILASGR